MATLRLKRSTWRRAGLAAALKTTTIYDECTMLCNNGIDEPLEKLRPQGNITF